MYFSGNLSIDPSQATEIDIIKPSKAFLRILNFVTAGSLDKKQERETFTAISILQQFNAVLRNLKITNIIRLCYNNIAFYEDTEGVEDDLTIALDAFTLDTDTLTSELFESLMLVLEHHDDKFQYLIEIDIKRVHAVGEPPISLTVNALPCELNQAESDQESIRRKLESEVFSTQEQHDNFLAQKQVAFDAFMQSLELGVRKFIHSESLKSESKKKMLRPSSKSKRTECTQLPTREPVFHAYPGSNVGDFVFYSLLWTSLTHSHDIHIHDTSILSDEGTSLLEIGEEGLDEEQNAVLDTEADLEDINIPASGYNSSETENSSFGFFGGDAIDSSSSDASCSSCASCGGD